MYRNDTVTHNGLSILSLNFGGQRRLQSYCNAQGGGIPAGKERMRKNVWLLVGLLVTMSLLSTACGGSGDTPPVKYADGCSAEEFPLGEFVAISAETQVLIEAEVSADGLQRWILRVKKDEVTTASVYTKEAYSVPEGFNLYEEAITHVILSADDVYIGNIMLADLQLTLYCPIYQPVMPAGSMES